ncbi:putative S-adenosyl-L-methionine-dependent methyltransferase [Cynara cardunculus var. scolymus]|uniref:Methyltransferase n=1 Tax=Cynara cardunculus var. scolymus TaxID=59895 RepID=A0A103XJI1_CYNCS|nr:putative S-adenosyl-L-methionine-dependent methyltransferase [Cynara cardunculus var. scolymus]
MGSKNTPTNRRRSPLSIIIIFGLCCFFYLLGTWQKSGFGKGDSIAMDITKKTECEDDFATLDFNPHHSIPIPDASKPKAKMFKPCDVKYTDYTPCHEQDRAMKFTRENMVYRERHCPPQEEKLKCLIPAPKGYSTPFPWPKGRDYVHYANVPFKHLTVEKANQHWVEFQGNVFKFPGGGTMFPQGADAYIDELASVIPIADGSVRTALDTGCGVASWGAYLMKRNVLAMSFAPRDNHEAQVQFALERGVPAIIGVLGSISLPFPSRAFDMAQCSRCLIPWGENDGMYLMEVDRVLRPGGFWILSGPPINWKTYYQTWKRSKEDLKAEQRKIEKLAESLCWEKKYEKGDIAIWRKKVNAESCQMKSVDIFKSANEVAGGELKKFPARLQAVPPRVSKGLIPEVSIESYQEDSKLWKTYVGTYKRTNRLIGTSRYRNIMDMNAGLGGFAAALDSNKLWVMNVVPTIAPNTLGVVYERGVKDSRLTQGHMTLFMAMVYSACMRTSSVILRDEVDVLTKVMKITAGMRWDVKLLDHEDGPFVPKKIFVASKQYWVGTKGNNTSSD